MAGVDGAGLLNLSGDWFMLSASEGGNWAKVKLLITVRQAAVKLVRFMGIRGSQIDAVVELLVLINSDLYHVQIKLFHPGPAWANLPYFKNRRKHPLSPVEIPTFRKSPSYYLTYVLASETIGEKEQNLTTGNQYWQDFLLNM